MTKTDVKQQIPKRKVFTKEDRVLDLPNLIIHQLDSWRGFVDTGLGEIFG